MNTVVKSLAALLLATPLFATAAEPAPPPAHDMGMGKEMMHGKDHDGWHKGKRCMDKGMGMHPPGPMVMIPMLPPGNEKQQLLMQAEIQQKVAEIVAKYANQLP
jgi:hypothetical protein